MHYPGRVIRQGERDAGIVAAVRSRLDAVLVLHPDVRDDAALGSDTAPVFDARMKSAVRLFQSRGADGEGNPLKIDGEIGAITWGALFGAAEVPSVSLADDALLARVMRVAAAEEAKPVREVPPNSNRGPDVDKYLKCVGVPPGHSWCAAFVYWCFDEAARNLGRPNPAVRTGGCLAHWNGAPGQGARRVVAARAKADPSLLGPGMVFIMDHGGGLGHTGLVESVAGGLITTLEGNSNNNGSREGVGVFRLTRKIASINKGYIDYAGA